MERNKLRKDEIFLRELYEVLSKEKIMIPYKIFQTAKGQLYVSMTNYMGRTILALYRTATKQPSLMTLMFNGIGFSEGYPEINRYKLQRKINYLCEKISNSIIKIIKDLKIPRRDEEIITDNISHNLLMLYKSYENCHDEQYLIKRIALIIANDKELIEMT